jgi:hypothetical protein
MKYVPVWFRGLVQENVADDCRMVRVTDPTWATLGILGHISTTPESHGDLWKFNSAAKAQGPAPAS